MDPDGADRSRLDHTGPLAGGLDPGLPIGSLQGQDAQAGAEALLGVGPVGHDRLEQRGGGRPDPVGGLHHPRRGPGGVAPMGAGHVLGNRDVAPPTGAPGVAGDAFSLVEGLDRAVGQAHVDQFSDQPEGDGVEAPLDLDVVVGSDAAALPGGEGVGLAGQRLQSGGVDVGEQFGAAGPMGAHDAGVELAHMIGDGQAQLGQAEEPLVAQAGHHPAFDQQNRLLDLGLVARLVGPGGHDGGSRNAGPSPGSCG